MNAAWASCPRWRNASLRISIIYAGRYITSLDSKTKTEGSYPGYTPGFFCLFKKFVFLEKLKIACQINAYCINKLEKGNKHKNIDRRINFGIKNGLFTLRHGMNFQSLILVGRHLN
jgi:hypothetical protein